MNRREVLKAAVFLPALLVAAERVAAGQEKRRIAARRQAFEKFCVERAEPYIEKKTGLPTWSAYDRMQHNTMIIGWGSFYNVDQSLAIDMREWQINVRRGIDPICVIEVRLEDTLAQEAF